MERKGGNGEEGSMGKQGKWKESWGRERETNRDYFPK